MALYAIMAIVAGCWTVQISTRQGGRLRSIQNYSCADLAVSASAARVSMFIHKGASWMMIQPRALADLDRHVHGLIACLITQKVGNPSCNLGAFHAHNLGTYKRIARKEKMIRNAGCAWALGIFSVSARKRKHVHVAKALT